MTQIRKRLEKILPEIEKESFMESKGLGNEIGYYVFDYDPEDELLVRDHIKYLKKKINQAPGEKRINEFDLYQIMIDILKKRGYLEKTMQKEKKEGSEKIFKAVKKSLRLSSNKNLYVKYIKKQVKPNDIVFLTGVGKAWPIVRSHTVLNNLHPVIDKNPVVLFFPGEYNGADLVLFGEIKDDNYYRAFSLVPREKSYF